jgi:hypothetical protein
MALTLHVDDRKIEEPDRAAIAREFAAIGQTAGFRGGGLSLVILTRGEDDSLTTAGHPVEGWGGVIREAKGVNRGAKISGSLTQEKIIHIFQSFARGDDLWEKEFEWDHLEKPGSWRMVIWLAVLLAVVFLVRKFLK